MLANQVEMNMESQLHQEMIDMFYISGNETGYWGRYFLRSVKKNGGLQTAKKMLSKRLENPSKQKGFQALIEVGRPDLSLESLVLQPRFRDLFSPDELDEAKRRLESVPEYARRAPVPVDEIYPEDIIEDHKFVEGAKKRITVNAYERDPQARVACLKRYGYCCQVCGMNFQDVYGDIGKHFIHVHHRKPLAGRRVDYKVKPTTDLVPVCPNCHAMLHTSTPPLGVEELKEKLANKSLQRIAKSRAR
ncbi:MAG: HNH endonuclease [Thermodesulfobacteriota bacterium]